MSPMKLAASLVLRQATTIDVWFSPVAEPACSGRPTTFLFMKFLVGVLCKICKFNLQNQYCRNICTNVIAKSSSD